MVASSTKNEEEKWEELPKEKKGLSLWLKIDFFKWDLDLLSIYLHTPLLKKNKLNLKVKNNTNPEKTRKKYKLIKLNFNNLNLNRNFRLYTQIETILEYILFTVVVINKPPSLNCLKLVFSWRFESFFTELYIFRCCFFSLFFSFSLYCLNFLFYFSPHKVVCWCLLAHRHWSWLANAMLNVHIYIYIEGCEKVTILYKAL